MTMAHQQRDDEEEAAGGLGSERLLSALRRRLRLALLIALTVSAGAMVIAKQLPNRYEAAAVIQIDPRKKSISNIEGALSELRVDQATIDSEVEVVRSRAILTRTIDILGLRTDPEFAGPTALRRLAMRLGLDSYMPGGATMPPPTPAAAADGTPAAAAPARTGGDEIAVALSDKLKVTRVRSTLLIEVRASSADPAKAARIANTIAEVYLADQLDQKSRAATVASDLLEEKIATIRTKLVDAERRVETYKAEHGIIDTEGGVTLSEKQIARLMEQTVNARNTTAEARAKYEQAQKLARSGDSGTSLADVLQSNTIRNMKEQLGTAHRRAAELSTKYGPNHPEIRKVRAEISEAQAALETEGAKLVANLRNEAETAEERERQLNANLTALKTHQISSKDDSVELKQLEREAQTTKQLFETLLVRFKQTSETRGLQLPDARIVEQADPPLFPVAPKRKQIAIAGLIGGILAGMMAALAADLLTNGLARPEDVEHVLELAHLSSLPRVPPEPASGAEPMRAMRLVVADPIAPFTEAIRAAKREIDLRRISRRARVIVVASSLPNEGSSVVASNLAHHYALAGANVLLVDGDLRRAGLSRLLGGNRGIGLLEALSTGRAVEDAILRDATTGLHFLPAMGPAPVRLSSPELLASPRMHATLDSLRRQFDTIIIDAPPLLPVLDGRILADHCDQIVMVMTWRRTPKQMARRALKALGANAPKILGVVVNEVDDDLIADARGMGGGAAPVVLLGHAA